MQRIEEIKNKRQAQHIFDRWKKAKEIEKQKDIREVQRDLALIRSPAAGLKRPAKEMEIENDGEDMEDEPAAAATELDTSIKLSSKKKSKVRTRARIVEEVLEDSDREMEEV